MRRRGRGIVRIQNSEFRDKVIASEAKQSRNRHCVNGLPRPKGLSMTKNARSFEPGVAGWRLKPVRRGSVQAS